MTAFTHEKRRILTPTERAVLFEKSAGRCSKCTRKIRAGETWTADHIIPLACGGNNDDENWQVLCDFCDGEKTPDDLSRAAKIKRQAIAHTVPKEFRRSRAWGRR